MARTASSFKKKAPEFSAQPIVLIITEDSKSCCDYLKKAVQYYRSSAKVEVWHCGKTDPIGIVDVAIGQSAKYQKVLCVIDRDTHQRFDEAVRLAATNSKVKLMVSYPCFEYWVFLHFQRRRPQFAAVGAHSPCDMVGQALREIEECKDYKKGAVGALWEQLLPRLPDAIANAKYARADAVASGSPNPSTDMDRVIEELVGLGAPQLV